MGQQFGTEHRREGQGHEARKTDGGGHGDREFREKTSGFAGPETDRHEDCRKHKSRRQDSEHHLVGAPDGRQKRMFPFFDAAVNVFQHDDCVVHHHADGQNQRQKREDVDAVAEDVQNDERTDQGDRNSQRGDQRRLQGTKEQEDDQKNQHRRNQQGFLDLLDGSVDEFGLIPENPEFHSFRKALGEFFQERFGSIGNRQGVCGGLLVNPDSDHGLFVGGEELACVARTEGNLRHVAQADVIAVRAAFENHVAEILGRVVLTVKAHHEFTFGGLDSSAGIFHIFCIEGGFDVAHGDSARGHGGTV